MAGRRRGRGAKRLGLTPDALSTYHAQLRLVAGGAIGVVRGVPLPPARLALGEGCPNVDQTRGVPFCARLKVFSPLD
jgi:hypothetical protein